MLKRPSDFEKFWSKTLKLARARPLKFALTPLKCPVAGSELFDFRLRGFEGAALAGFYMLPKKRKERIPAVLQYHGYASNKGEPEDYAHWLKLGMAVLAMDVRGQLGDSTDNAVYEGGHAAGWMTQGILEASAYYYRKVYLDAIIAMDFLSSRPEIDAGRILANGDSQGGGLALALASLDPRPALCAADNPSLIDFEGRLKGGGAGSIEELRLYLGTYPERSKAAFRTLAYFDLLNHLDFLRCPSLWSASSDDPISLASTVEAGFERAGSTDKAFHQYREMGHEVHPRQLEVKLAWVERYFLA
jgi:cephalosporin-C deacetylase